MSTQPEALRLAELIETATKVFGGPASNIATELRRLHAVNTELLEALTKLLDMHERCDAGFTPHVELRFAIRDMARTSIAKATGEQA